MSSIAVSGFKASKHFGHLQMLSVCFCGLNSPYLGRRLIVLCNWLSPDSLVSNCVNTEYACGIPTHICLPIIAIKSQRKYSKFTHKNWRTNFLDGVTGRQYLPYSLLKILQKWGKKHKHSVANQVKHRSYRLACVGVSLSSCGHTPQIEEYYQKKKIHASLVVTNGANCS